MIKARAVPVPSDSVLAPLYVDADLLPCVHYDLSPMSRDAHRRHAWRRSPAKQL